MVRPMPLTFDGYQGQSKWLECFLNVVEAGLSGGLELRPTVWAQDSDS